MYTYLDGTWHRHLILPCFQSSEGHIRSYMYDRLTMTLNNSVSERPACSRSFLSDHLIRLIPERFPFVTSSLLCIQLRSSVCLLSLSITVLDLSFILSFLTFL